MKADYLRHYKRGDLSRNPQGRYYEGTLSAEFVRNVMGLVMKKPPKIAALKKLTAEQMVIWADYAWEQHLIASDNVITHRLLKPKGWPEEA